MFLLLPFIAGAGATGYLWYNSSSKEEEKPSLEKDLLNVAKYSGIIIVVLLLLRWLYVKGSVQKPPNNG